MNSSIATQQVTLQENGIIRDGKGNYLGRIVEDIDALCEKHYQRGRVNERNACVKVCQDYENRLEGMRDDDYQAEIAGRQMGAARCAKAIMARGELDCGGAQHHRYAGRFAE